MGLYEEAVDLALQVNICMAEILIRFLFLALLSAFSDEPATMASDSNYLCLEVIINGNKTTKQQFINCEHNKIVGDLDTMLQKIILA
jgi:hypothetical protein